MAQGVASPRRTPMLLLRVYRRPLPRTAASKTRPCPACLHSRRALQPGWHHQRQQAPGPPGADVLVEVEGATGQVDETFGTRLERALTHRHLKLTLQHPEGLVLPVVDVGRRAAVPESVSAYAPPVSSPHTTKLISSSVTHSFSPSPGDTQAAPRSFASMVAFLTPTTAHSVIHIRRLSREQGQRGGLSWNPCERVLPCGRSLTFPKLVGRGRFDGGAIGVTIALS